MYPSSYKEEIVHSIYLIISFIENVATNRINVNYYSQRCVITELGKNNLPNAASETGKAYDCKRLQKQPLRNHRAYCLPRKHAYSQRPTDTTGSYQTTEQASFDLQKFEDNSVAQTRDRIHPRVLCGCCFTVCLRNVWWSITDSKTKPRWNFNLPF